VKLFATFIVFAVILLCFIGMTQNEFIGEANIAIGSQIDTGMAVAMNSWDTNDLAMIEESILLGGSSLTIINNEDRFPNPFNIIYRIESCAIITGQTETNNDTFAYKYTIFRQSHQSMRSDNYGHTFGAANLKYPMQNLLVG